jgi:hypothetical protein
MAEVVTEVTEEIGNVDGFLHPWHAVPTQRALNINGSSAPLK